MTPGRTILRPPLRCAAAVLCALALGLPQPAFGLRTRQPAGAALAGLEQALQPLTGEVPNSKPFLEPDVLWAARGAIRHREDAWVTRSYAARLRKALENQEVQVEGVSQIGSALCVWCRDSSGDYVVRYFLNTTQDRPEDQAAPAWDFRVTPLGDSPGAPPLTVQLLTFQEFKTATLARSQHQHLFWQYTLPYLAQPAVPGDTAYIATGDLDFLRKLNDVYGKTIVNDLLTRTHLVIRQELDNIEAEYQLSHRIRLLFGGDEFSIAFPPSALTPSEVEQLMERVRQAVETAMRRQDGVAALRELDTALAAMSEEQKAGFLRRLRRLPDAAPVLDLEPRTAGHLVSFRMADPDAARNLAVFVAQVNGLLQEYGPHRVTATYDWLLNDDGTFTNFRGGHLWPATVSIGVVRVADVEQMMVAGGRLPRKWNGLAYHQKILEEALRFAEGALVAAKLGRNSVVEGIPPPGPVDDADRSLNPLVAEGFLAKPSPDPARDHRHPQVMREPPFRKVVSPSIRRRDPGSLIEIKPVYGGELLEQADRFTAEERETETRGNEHGVGFRFVNDTLGHQRGDLVIGAVLQALIQSLPEGWKVEGKLPPMSRFVDRLRVYVQPPDGTLPTDEEIGEVLDRAQALFNEKVNGVTVTHWTAVVVNTQQLVGPPGRAWELLEGTGVVEVPEASRTPEGHHEVRRYTPALDPDIQRQRESVAWRQAQELVAWERADPYRWGAIWARKPLSPAGLEEGAPAVAVIVGAGPAGLGAAEEMLAGDRSATVVIINANLLPGGRAVTGVRPDKEAGLKARWRGVRLPILDDPRVVYLGGLRVGPTAGITLDTLGAPFDGALRIVAAGADRSRALGVPGEFSPGIYDALDLVDVYNGNPRRALQRLPELDAPVLGMGAGNVDADFLFMAIHRREFAVVDQWLRGLGVGEFRRLMRALGQTTEGTFEGPHRELAENLWRARPAIGRAVPLQTVVDGLTAVGEGWQAAALVARWTPAHATPVPPIPAETAAEIQRTVAAEIAAGRLAPCGPLTVMRPPDPASTTALIYNMIRRGPEQKEYSTAELAELAPYVDGDQLRQAHAAVGEVQGWDESRQQRALERFLFARAGAQTYRPPSDDARQRRLAALGTGIPHAGLTIQFHFLHQPVAFVPYDGGLAAIFRRVRVDAEGRMVTGPDDSLVAYPVRTVVKAIGSQPDVEGVMGPAQNEAWGAAGWFRQPRAKGVLGVARRLGRAAVSERAGGAAQADPEAARQAAEGLRTALANQAEHPVRTISGPEALQLQRLLDGYGIQPDSDQALLALLDLNPPPGAEPGQPTLVAWRQPWVALPPREDQQIFIQQPLSVRPDVAAVLGAVGVTVTVISDNPGAAQAQLDAQAHPGDLILLAGAAEASAWRDYIRFSQLRARVMTQGLVDTLVAGPHWATFLASVEQVPGVATVTAIEATDDGLLIYL